MWRDRPFRPSPLINGGVAGLAFDCRLLVRASLSASVRSLEGCEHYSGRTSYHLTSDLTAKWKRSEAKKVHLHLDQAFHCYSEAVGVCCVISGETADN